MEIAALMRKLCKGFDKNPSYRRHLIFQRVHIVTPIPMKMGENGCTQAKFGHNWSKLVEIGHTGQNWSKHFKRVPNGSDWVKMSQNW